jgi:hypothetical protein
VADPRYLRQLLLKEIGPEGQAQIAAATAFVGDEGLARQAALHVDCRGLAHDVAERYARGAGFGAIAEGPIDVAALAPPDVAAPSARAVLAGARAALAAMRTALGFEGSAPERQPAIHEENRS